MDSQYLNIPEEIWKPIPGFPGYDISDQGRVRSYWGSGQAKTLKDTPQRFLRPSGKTYLQVTLTKDGEHFTFLVHRLVLETFVGPCPDDLQACHNDGNPMNLRTSNLRWDTQSSNATDRIKHGNGLKTKLTPDQVVEIRELYLHGLTQVEIAILFDVYYTTIGDIVNRRTWRHL